MGNPVKKRRRMTSFQKILLGFIGVIILGALILMLPISAKSRTVTPFNQALFTSTSAVCVTGLIVQDTATYWSGFGQAVILVLIQIGGLGVGSGIDISELAVQAADLFIVDKGDIHLGVSFEILFPEGRDTRTANQHP